MLQHHETERALWEAFTLGEVDAYEALYREYHPRFFNYGHKFTPDTELVEDCIQEVMARIWAMRQKLTEVDHISSYLFVAYRNSIVRSIQSNRKRSPFGGAEYDFSLEASIEQIMIDRERIYERHVCLNKAVEKLTGRQKEAVYFLFYENMSYGEVASILHISRKAAYKLVARALAELKTIYRQQGVVFMLPFLFLF